MAIFGIGIDLVEVERIKVSIAKHGELWIQRVFTSAERAYCEGQHDPAIHYAARFAAKEAVVKAFGTGIGEHAALNEVEVVSTAKGAPKVVLHGAAKDFAKEQGIAHVLVSLTHTKDHAAANAVAETAS